MLLVDNVLPFINTSQAMAKAATPTAAAWSLVMPKSDA
jgi:hypothetical protein